MLALDAGGHAIGRIVDLPAQSAPATPVLAPTRKSLVFALTQQPDKKTGFGSDLYAVNLDGTGYKPVVQHESDNVFYASPRFDASGNLLYFHRRAALISTRRRLAAKAPNHIAGAGIQGVDPVIAADIHDAIDHDRHALQALQALDVIGPLALQIAGIGRRDLFQ